MRGDIVAGGYDPNLDFFALLRPTAGAGSPSQLVRRMPILDLLIYTLAEANLLNLYVGYSAPTANQNSTAWLLPQNPSWAGPGTMMLWDQTQSSGTGAYVPATPALFTALLDYQGNLVTEGNGPPPALGVAGSVYFRLDNGQIWYVNNQGVWTLFQTAVANIGLYITGHGGPGDPLDVNLAALEAELAADMAGKIAVTAVSPITGNGLTATPLGINQTAEAQALIANGGLNLNVAVQADGITVGGDGRSINPLLVTPSGLYYRVAVQTDGVTVTGNGLASNPLVAHLGAAGISVVSPITGNGSSSSPLGLDYTATAAGLVSNGGLNQRVQVAVDGSTVTGNGTAGSPLVAHAAYVGAPGGTLQASGAFALVPSGVGGAPGPPYPGFPNGIIPTAGYVQVGYCQGCTVTHSTPGDPGGPASWPGTVTVTFNTAQPDVNWRLVSSQIGAWQNQAITATSPSWEIISQTFSATGFNFQFQPVGPAGNPEGVFTFLVIR